MSHSLTKKQKYKQPRFDLINRYNVAIISLRNQLKNADGVEELANIASNIIDLEQRIVAEKSIGFRKLETEKVMLRRKIDKILRSLASAESELSRVDNVLDFKLTKNQRTLQEKVDKLNEEYNKLIQSIGQDSY